MSDAQNRLLAATGQAPATSYAAYLQQGGYLALRNAVSSLSPAQVLDEIRASGLRGRGGAGVLTAEKLALVARAGNGTRYLVCNAYDADERSLAAATLLEHYPHVVLEGLALAAYAIGATEVYLYVRSTRTDASEAIQAAAREAVAEGVLGRGICGSHVDCTVTVAGVERGFMGGEESSLLEILKGRPMKAQQRPPYPTQAGLFGEPTAVQNVETLANLPRIVARGGQSFRTEGTAASPGTKLLTVYGAEGGAGQVVEVPFGTPLSQVLRMAGHRVTPETARAVVVGGAEGGALPLDRLETPLDYDALEEVGAIVGSSMVEVLPAGTCMVQWAMRRSSYLADQSCGKCIPCRVGVKRVATTLEGIVSGLGNTGDIALLEEFVRYIADGSLCGFGVNAGNAVATAYKYFPEDFTAHLEGRCPTAACTPVRAHRYAVKHVL